MGFLFLPFFFGLGSYYDVLILILLLAVMAWLCITLLPFRCRFLHNFGSGREVCIEDVLIGGGRVNS